ncbi:hypothetical protein AB0395_02615 [Streptosporangium sp. NPDC051023]|uniref:hypothetical protein n=1 Tax=Streptosporangium sp. NPDC051023 TaxID=3155410 RepID=UPI00344B63B2
MKRVISTVVAVAAFGLAAATCVPAQAQSQGRGRDVLGGRDVADALSPKIVGLTGGLVGGGTMLNGLGDRIALGDALVGGNAPGGLDGLDRLAGGSGLTGPDGPVSAWEAPVGEEAQGGRSADGVERLLMRVSDAVEEFVDISADRFASDGASYGSPTDAGANSGSLLPKGAGGLTGLMELMNGPGGPSGRGEVLEGGGEGRSPGQE